MRKVLSLLLCAGLMAVLAVPALADTPPGQVILNGKVDADNADINVTMPYKLEFAVLTNADDTFAAITHVEGEVKNNSNKNQVQLEVAAVQDPGGLLDHMDLALAPMSVVDNDGNGTVEKAEDEAVFGVGAGHYVLNDVLSQGPAILITGLENGVPQTLTTCAQAQAGKTIPTGTYTVTATIAVSRYHP